MKTFTTLFLASAFAASALVIPKDSGTWPDDWPEELEPLRERSRTTEWATGSQEDSHRIPFTDRAEFEKLWPVISKLLKPGGHINLVTPHKEASLVRDWTAACVVVHTSPGATGELKDRDGMGHRTQAPWPDSARLPDGTLAEYVVLGEKDGEPTWVPMDEDNKFKGFHFRARLDITLVCDGKVIDPDRILKPKGVVIDDRRSTD